MQLLYVANRYERKPDLQRWLDGGLILVCDRYIASSIAYGEAQGLDPAWLTDIQKFLPPAVADDPARHRAGDGRRSARPSIAIATSATSRCRRACARATTGRRRRDGWVVLDGERPKDATIAGRRSSLQPERSLQRPRCTLDDSRCRKRAHLARRPPSFSTRAHASSVAPVVLTSSTSTTVASGEPARAARRQRTRRARSRAARAAGSSACGAVARDAAQRVRRPAGRDAARDPPPG